MSAPTLTVERLTALLAHDSVVKVAGIDIDGIPRGKVMEKSKFLSAAKHGFGFCSVIFGWDMHDAQYFPELGVSNAKNGYRDLLAKIDLDSMRRIPWERDLPLFLVRFYEEDGKTPICADPRGLLRGVLDGLKAKGWTAMAGAEFEYFQFKGEWCVQVLRREQGREEEHICGRKTATLVAGGSISWLETGRSRGCRIICRNGPSGAMATNICRTLRTWTTITDGREAWTGWLVRLPSALRVRCTLALSFVQADCEVKLLLGVAVSCCQSRLAASADIHPARLAPRNASERSEQELSRPRNPHQRDARLCES